MDKTDILVLLLFQMFVCDTGECMTCFKCDNGDSLKPNINCPAEGNVVFAEKEVCNGKCFIRTRDRNIRVVVERGCFQKPWLKKVVRNGCDVIRNDIWCFCDTDDCNGRRLGDWFPVS